MDELVEATRQKHCDNLLGEGGFGVVYKGYLLHTIVAIKFLTQVSRVLSCVHGVDTMQSDYRKVWHPLVWDMGRRKIW